MNMGVIFKQALTPIRFYSTLNRVTVPTSGGTSDLRHPALRAHPNDAVLHSYKERARVHRPSRFGTNRVHGARAQSPERVARFGSLWGAGL